LIITISIVWELAFLGYHFGSYICQTKTPRAKINNKTPVYNMYVYELVIRSMVTCTVWWW